MKRNANPASAAANPNPPARLPIEKSNRESFKPTKLLSSWNPFIYMDQV
ncbi:MAG: hypothetical protein QW569_05085 [Candidatus Bathyarchaeia archaeon]